ncbi:MAG: hypothetical protein H6983_16375 [Ectothiorhodospiraceae bacterium]|nr:hypothetical protein [Ectothiorhodospiraceae bacterium]
MLQRQRTVDACAMVLGFGTGRERTLAGLRRAYQGVTGQSLVSSSFYDRFTAELTRLLRALVKELLVRLAKTGTRAHGALSMFEDVLAADATVVKLDRLLAGRYPGTRSNSSPAAAKLHLVMSVKDGGAQTVKVTGERASDHRTLRMGASLATYRPASIRQSLRFNLQPFRPTTKLSRA